MGTIVKLGNNTGDDIYGTNDTMLRYVAPDSNYDVYTDTQINYYSAVDLKNILIKFTGIGSLPSSIVANSASLYFYNFNGGTAFDTDWHRVLVNWDAAQATWNSRLTGTSWTTAGAESLGNDIANTPSINYQFPAWTVATWISMSSAQFATDIQDMANGLVVNYGWLGKRDPASGTGKYDNIRQSEEGDGLRPYILLDYDLAGGGFHFLEQMWW